MITLKKLEWSNLFSYSKSNILSLNEYPIIQLLGKNGHGKSSIALILEEVLYNKNSKGIKKSDILNRYIKDKSYSINLTFDKDGDDYEIQTSRGSSQTVALFKNKDNISAHTATNTFKLIEDILGFDHKTFAQLIYQSSSSSLEFLTATDTNRKKFLIDLLNLSKYMEAFEYFKNLVKEYDINIKALEVKINTVQTWLDKHLKESLDVIEPKEYPVYIDNLEDSIAKLKIDISNIDSTNKKITKNELLKRQLNNIDINKLMNVDPHKEDISSELSEIGSHQKVIKDANNFIATNLKKAIDICPTCGGSIDSSKIKELLLEQEELKKSAEQAIEKLNKVVLTKNNTNKEIDKLLAAKQEWETLHSLIDPKLEQTTINPDDLNNQLKSLEAEYKKRTSLLLEIEHHNTKAAANNSRVQLIMSQMEEMKNSIKGYAQELSQLNDRFSILQILQKTFSTNGLIAYKIECMIKDLEDLTNKYLSELSSGRFQLYFKITSSDKLSVIITDNGRDIEIVALSGGERARVNTATLLAIRKLMQSLSSARVNLLILDETIDSLDAEGKEKLIDVLLNEEHLNTILVSHGYTHPLLEKISVIKEHNISRLE